MLRPVAVAGVQGHRARHRLWSVAVSTKLSFISEGETQSAMSQEVKTVMCGDYDSLIHRKMQVNKRVTKSGC